MSPSQQNKDARPGKSPVFDFLTECIGWIQIAISPALLGAILGGLLYLIRPGKLTLVIGIVICASGVVTGIIWATIVWKKGGTVNYISRNNRLENSTGLSEKEDPD